MAELEEFRAQAAVEEQNENLIKHDYEEMNKRNAEVMKEVYSLDATYYFPSGITEPMTLEQEIEQFKMFLPGIPDLVHNIIEIISEGDRIIVKFNADGTFMGNLGLGIKPTGDEVRVSSIVIYRIANGKIVEEWQEADRLSEEIMGREERREGMEKG